MNHHKWPVSSPTGQKLAKEMCGPIMYPFTTRLMQRALWDSGAKRHCPHCGARLKGYRDGKAKLIDRRAKGLYCTRCPEMQAVSA